MAKSWCWRWQDPGKRQGWVEWGVSSHPTGLLHSQLHAGPRAAGSWGVYHGQQEMWPDLPQEVPHPPCCPPCAGGYDLCHQLQRRLMLCEFLGGSGGCPSVGMTPDRGAGPQGRVCLASLFVIIIRQSPSPWLWFLPDILGWGPQLRSEGRFQVVRSSRIETSFQAELKRVGILGPLVPWAPAGLGASITPFSLPRGILGAHWLVKSRADGFLLGCCPGKRPAPKYVIRVYIRVSPNTADGSRSK